jgi:hypothetical protein
VAQNGEGNATFLLRQVGPRRVDPNNNPQRSVYMAIVRDQVPEVLTLFDFPDPSLIAGERSTTTIPAQSLYLLDNPFVIAQAETLADKLLASGDDDAGKLARAYQLCYSRPPTANETLLAQKFLDDYGKKQSRRSTWAALVQALFAGSEFSYR